MDTGETDADYLKPQSIRNLVKRKVYSTSGFLVGTSTDVEFEWESGNLTGLLIQARKDLQGGKKILIPFELVTAVGDIILVNSEVSRDT
ncbi:MAG: PRC-barrel domain-containing protein [Promethearchaeota archaeon]